ncbi:MAG TPA: M48 family metallopeptidase [Alphaproteobacteria bacterium]|nr:M48 family metallopeptidase [Alphaproteobacteria bacterium]
MIREFAKSAFALAALAPLLLAGCGSETPRVAVSESDLKAEEQVQNDLALDATLHQHARLLDVAFPISVASAELCGTDVIPGFGLNIADISNLRKELREPAQRRLNLGDAPQILHIVPGSPADKAGLKEGERIVALGGTKIAAGDDAANATMDILRDARSGALEFEVADRNGNARKVSVTPLPMCSYAFYIGKSDSVNAFADGKSVVIMAGMMRFAASDQELALVLSHEMAHNVMRDSQTMPATAIPGAIVDFVVSDLFGINTRGTFTRGGGRSYTQDFEAEADTVGLYMMARAGFDIDGAPEFWRRIAANYPESIKDSLSALHPPSPYRSVLLKTTIAEIKKKQADGEALVPDQFQTESAADRRPAAGATAAKPVSSN